MAGGRIGTARVGILTIIEEELLAMFAALGSFQEIRATGYYADSDAFNVVIKKSADRGNTPATHATRDLIEDFQPEVIIVVGIAGGIAGREGIQPGDMVVADFLHYSDFRKITSAGDLRRYAAYDQPSVSFREQHTEPAARQDSWRERLQQDPPRECESKIVLGGVVAAEKVLGDIDHEAHKYVVETFDNAVAVDMESFGVGRAVHEARRDVGYNPQLAVIRGISDLVATEATEVADNNQQRQAWKAYAAAAAAAFAYEVLDRFLALPEPRPDLRGGA